MPEIFTYYKNVLPEEMFVLLLVIIAVIFAICLSFLLRIIFRRRERKYIQAIKRNSRRYNDIVALNRVYHFNDLPEYYSKTAILDTKSKYDRFDYDRFFEKVAETNKWEIRELEALVRENIQLKGAYDAEMRKIWGYTSNKKVKELHLNWRKFHEMEISLVNAEIQNPITNIWIKCTKTYVSPQGRNSYMDYKIYSLEDFRHALETVEMIRKKKEDRKYQRSIMTEAIRYDVLKRDGFHCVLCGRGAIDGVKLHVDHIRPISKGGKTVMSNLRTLCEECNRGKSDKYDEDDIN